VNLTVPPTPARALTSLIYHRTRLRLRGLAFRERAEADVPREELRRIDALWAAGLGLCNVDMVRGMDFLARHLRRALAAGEPYRVARGLALEAMFTGGSGGAAVTRAAAIALDAETIAARLQNPRAMALAALARAMVAFCRYDFVRCRAGAERAIEILGAHGVTAGWEVGSAHYFHASSLEYLGDLSALARSGGLALSIARESGDLYTHTTLRTYAMRMHWLAQDRPELAQQEIESAIRGWTVRRFSLQNGKAAAAAADVALYRGDGKQAAAIASAAHSQIRRARLLSIEPLRLRWWDTCARAALAAAQTSGVDRERHLRNAERLGHKLLHARSRLSLTFAHPILAGAAHLRGQHERALTWLTEGERHATAVDMSLHATVARRRRGQLLGGDEGRNLVESADAWMASQGVRNPERLTAMFAPGFIYGAS
jgi:hypothetical protein